MYSTQMALVDATVLITGKNRHEKTGKDAHFILIQGTRHRQTLYPKRRHINFIKQALLDVKLQINLDIVVGSDFNAPLSITVSSSERKRKQRNSELNDIQDEMDPNGHLQTTLCKHDKIFILLRSPWNFLPDGSCTQDFYPEVISTLQGFSASMEKFLFLYPYM